MTEQPGIVGWDIGGVNTKAVRMPPESAGPATHSVCMPYEIRHEPGALPRTLVSVGRQLGVESTDLHAVTMTAELSQAFRTKREGVWFVLDAVEDVFPGDRIHVYTVGGRFVSPHEARGDPHAAAASNWSATAHWVAQHVSTCVLIDIGTTTTDLIPIVSGKVVAQGHTDPERLLHGELLYSGALRTPVEAIASHVPLWGGSASVSADGFALIGDAHLWLGRLSAEEYTCPAPDGRPATREYAGERLARTVCADREMLDQSAIDDVAAGLAGAQLQTIVTALEAIQYRWPEITDAVVTGLGEFIATEAARASGLAVYSLANRLGTGAQTAPAAAVAYLLCQSLLGDRR
jgi:(4-(4-[2-(gamma-L-glutamylamino)ethyl]phenoxymethyl)furan-2-yl)methanamine synthase